MSHASFSPLNLSVSKQLFSIPKAPRFRSAHGSPYVFSIFPYHFLVVPSSAMILCQRSLNVQHQSAMGNASKICYGQAPLKDLGRKPITNNQTLTNTKSQERTLSACLANTSKRSTSRRILQWTSGSQARANIRSNAM